MSRVLAPLALVGGVFSWWAWNDGAYFGTIFYPGAFVLGALMLLLLAFGPLRLSLRGPARVALVALAALGGWTVVSEIWTSVPSAPIPDAQRALTYAIAFCLGVWLCNLLGRRMTQVLWPVAGAGIVIGVATALSLAFSTDMATYFHDDATLKFPIGYRNANATFFMICAWPLLVLAAETVRGWAPKALMIGATTLMLELVVLAQSRGSLPAGAAALVVYILTSRRGLRAAIYAALAVLPVLVALPSLLTVFQHGRLGPDLVPVVHSAARVLLVSSAASVVLAAIFFGLVERRLHIGRHGVQRVSVVAAALSLVIAAVGIGLFVDRHGGPIGFLDQRVKEFNSGRNPDLLRNGTRFSANVGSNRADFWRVSLDEAASNPVVGGGAGSFQFTYLHDRDSAESPNDPHSVEMLMLSELGLVGFVLFATFAAGAVVAALRSRRLGPGAIAVSAGALASGTQWLVHSSYDWFWHYPAVTAPAIFLLGAAAAPHLLDPLARLSKVARALPAVLVGAVTLSLIPIYLSQRLVENAGSLARDDPGAALTSLDHAAKLDPFDVQALLVRGDFLDQLGRSSEALADYREAESRQPENYATHYFVARELVSMDPSEARRELRLALALNPAGPEIHRLGRELRGKRGSRPVRAG